MVDRHHGRLVERVLASSREMRATPTFPAIVPVHLSEKYGFRGARTPSCAAQSAEKRQGHVQGAMLAPVDLGRAARTRRGLQRGAKRGLRHADYEVARRGNSAPAQQCADQEPATLALCVSAKGPASHRLPHRHGHRVGNLSERRPRYQAARSSDRDSIGARRFSTGPVSSRAPGWSREGVRGVSDTRPQCGMKWGIFFIPNEEIL